MAIRLDASPLGHHFYFEEEAAHYSVYCFRQHGAAEAFRAAWCGEWLSPDDRKRGCWRARSRLLPCQGCSWS